MRECGRHKETDTQTDRRAGGRTHTHTHTQSTPQIYGKIHAFMLQEAGVKNLTENVLNIHELLRATSIGRRLNIGVSVAP